MQRGDIFGFFKLLFMTDIGLYWVESFLPIKVTGMAMWLQKITPEASLPWLMAKLMTIPVLVELSLHVALKWVMMLDNIDDPHIRAKVCCHHRHTCRNSEPNSKLFDHGLTSRGLLPDYASKLILFIIHVYFTMVCILIYIMYCNNFRGNHCKYHIF